MKKNTNTKAIEILNFINNEIQEKGYPPSVREICRAVGLKSPSTVHAYLEKLRKEGLITKEPSKPRALRINTTENINSYNPVSEIINVPIVGDVTAGQPILAVENIQGSFPLPIEFAKNSDIFILTVKGDSMLEAGILDGDLIFINKQKTANNGDIVVALIDSEVTVKTFYKEKEHIRLQPQNKYYDPIILKDNIDILGKVIGVFRKI